MTHMSEYLGLVEVHWSESYGFVYYFQLSQGCMAGIVELLLRDYTDHELGCLHFENEVVVAGEMDEKEGVGMLDKREVVVKDAEHIYIWGVDQSWSYGHHAQHSLSYCRSC